MTGVLVDTSVWRRFFGGSSNARPLQELLEEEGAVILHRWVLGELVLGGLSTREEGLLRQLPLAQQVSDDDVLAMVRQRRLSRRGIGWVDAQLLASALASGGELWSFDSDLADAASDLGVAYSPC